MAPVKKDPPAVAPDKVAVILRSTTRPGIKSCGEYLPDRPYLVSPAEANRLITAKGFEPASAGDALKRIGEIQDAKDHINAKFAAANSAASGEG